MQPGSAGVVRVAWFRLLPRTHMRWHAQTFDGLLGASPADRKRDHPRTRVLYGPIGDNFSALGDFEE